MNLPVAPLAAALLGGAAAACFALMPAPLLESLVVDSGIPAIVAAAEPPLGMTARLAVSLGAGGLVGLFSWLALFILLGTRGLTIGRGAEVEDVVATPVVRRADAHPDAPPRPPLLATRDLGTPFLEVTAREAIASEPPAPMPMPIGPVTPLFAPEPEFVADREPQPAAAQMLPEEQPLPADLDQPLAAFDPDAILDVPMPPPVSLAPIRRAPRPAVFDAGERFETFELTPVRRAPPPPRPEPVAREDRREEAITRPETEATVHALLERLERGVVRRGLAAGAERPRTPRESERGLEDALVTLRNLARRAG